MSQGSTGNSPWHDDKRLAIGKGLSGLLWSIHAKRSAGLLFAEMQAYRRWHQELASCAIVGLGKSRRSASDYQCPSCDIRQLGIQRSGDCRTFMAHVGIVELYPH